MYNIYKAAPSIEINNLLVCVIKEKNDIKMI